MLKSIAWSPATAPVFGDFAATGDLEFGSWVLAGVAADDDATTARLAITAPTDASPRTRHCLMKIPFDGVEAG
jgi:hypothetical protein